MMIFHECFAHATWRRMAPQVDAWVEDTVNKLRPLVVSDDVGSVSLGKRLYSESKIVGPVADGTDQPIGKNMERLRKLKLK